MCRLNWTVIRSYRISTVGHVCLELYYYLLDFKMYGISSTTFMLTKAKNNLCICSVIRINFLHWPMLQPSTKFHQSQGSSFSVHRQQKQKHPVYVCVCVCALQTCPGCRGCVSSWQWSPLQTPGPSWWWPRPSPSRKVLGHTQMSAWSLSTPAARHRKRESRRETE